MAYITTEIKDLIKDFEDIENEIDYLEWKKKRVYDELVEKGMSEKQLENRGIHPW